MAKKENGKNKVDPKEIDVPNTCFSLIDEGDDDRDVYKKQRLERGFDDSETWSLRDTIAKFIIPRLERYQELSSEYVKRDSEEVKDVDKFLKAMKLVVKRGEGDTLTDQEEKKIMKGLEKFPSIFMSLSW